MIIESGTQLHVYYLSTPVCHSVLNVKVVVAAFNQEKALVGAFSVITNLRMEHFEAILATVSTRAVFCCGCVLTPQLPCSACWLQPVNHLQ